MIQYKKTIIEDASIIDLEMDSNGRATFALKITTGAPSNSTIAGLFEKGAQIMNIYDGSWYENTGTVASPTWSLVPSSGSGITTLTGDVTAGPGVGSQAAIVVKASGNFKVFGDTILGDTSTQTISFVGKQIGTLYRNETASAVMSLKMHNHLSTATMNAEYKYETINTSGANYGIYNEAHISATGTASVTASLNAAVVASTFTVTGGTIIGCYGQARADGTVAGASFMAGLYGLIEEGGGAITASHVASAWLDSHRNTAVTGNHELLYMTNNGTATMDQAIYIYGGNKISKLMELNTVSGMVGAANGAGSDVYIDFTINGTAARLVAKYVV